MTELQEFFEGLNQEVEFTFQQRPDNFPGEYRVAWRVCVACMLLARGRAGVLSIPHMHVLWWSLKSETTREIFIRWSNGMSKPDDLVVRFDPALSYTIDLLIGENLAVRTSTGKIKLSEKGRRLFEDVSEDSLVLQREKSFIDQLPKSISQRYMEGLLS